MRRTRRRDTAPRGIASRRGSTAATTASASPRTWSEATRSNVSSTATTASRRARYSSAELETRWSTRREPERRVSVPSSTTYPMAPETGFAWAGP